MRNKSRNVSPDRSGLAGLAGARGVGNRPSATRPAGPLPPLPPPHCPGAANRRPRHRPEKRAASRPSCSATSRTLASTGTLGGAGDSLGTGLGATNILGLGSAEALHAARWVARSSRVRILAGNLAMTLAGTGISADLILSRAQAVAGSGTRASRHRRAQHRRLADLRDRSSESGDFTTGPHGHPERADSVGQRHRRERPARDDARRVDRCRPRFRAGRYLGRSTRRHDHA